jgi:hypothetical protein
LERPDLYLNYRFWNEGTPGSQSSNDLLLAKIRRRMQADFMNDSDVRWKKSLRIRGRLYLHFDSRFQWPDPRQPIRSRRGTCHGLSSHIGVLADGIVVPCCLDKEGVISLGNGGAQELGDIVQSPRAASIREGFQKGILVEDLCQRCTYIARFDNKVECLEKRS